MPKDKNSTWLQQISVLFVTSQGAYFLENTCWKASRMICVLDLGEFTENIGWVNIFHTEPFDWWHMELNQILTNRKMLFAKSYLTKVLPRVWICLCRNGQKVNTCSSKCVSTWTSWRRTTLVWRMWTTTSRRYVSARTQPARTGTSSDVRVFDTLDLALSLQCWLDPTKEIKRQIRSKFACSC